MQEGQVLWAMLLEEAVFGDLPMNLYNSVSLSCMYELLGIQVAS